MKSRDRRQPSTKGRPSLGPICPGGHTVRFSTYRRGTWVAFVGFELLLFIGLYVLPGGSLGFSAGLTLLLGLLIGPLIFLGFRQTEAQLKEFGGRVPIAPGARVELLADDYADTPAAQGTQTPAAQVQCPDCGELQPWGPSNFCRRCGRALR